MSSRSAILTYHSLDDTGSVISISPWLFRRQMEALAENEIPVVPLSQIYQHSGAVAITFDDGFASFADVAVPVLQRFSFPATVFVVSGYCGGYNDWPTQSPGIPRTPLMSWAVLRDLPRNVAVGAHTVTHQDLRSLGNDEMRREVCQSRTQIEQEIGRTVDSFAYPYGGVNPRSAALVRAEFGCGCSTRLAFAHAGSDPAVLPRLDTYYLKWPRWCQNPVGPVTRMYIGLRALPRLARGWARSK